ncbi:OmpA family protein [Alterinioella nitratireducens]|uniref:OmpA family protein n=1 Tax=Alterinioella nitratireducens TaxID=2735915 RepID=UPI001556DFAA|nr:OmpA family protein [Alterinioella nitratireducens]NPD18489.1 OmpA family protein [Alterinioella nitratireducens]
MRISFTFAAIASFALAAGISLGLAVIGAQTVERQSVEDVSFAMREDGLDWVEIDADGLQVFLMGEAPDEATRFRALRRAGTVVDSDRVVDQMTVLDPEGITAPTFSIEMLRNGTGVSLIGLIPGTEGADRLTDGISDITAGLDVANMVETADFAAPEGWDAAVRYGLLALTELPRSKVSIFAGRVEVEAVSNSPAERAGWVAFLEDNLPDGIDLVMDISAPRPVITPFTLRYVVEDGTPRFEACSVGTEADRDRILETAIELGVAENASCVIGLGVPSPRWAEAVETAITAASRFEGATLTFSDADLSLVAAEGTPGSLFDTVIGELDAALPDVFSLHAVLPAAPAEGSEPDGPPRFTATRSPEGYVQLRGRLPDDRVSAAVLAYANALFGRRNTYLATRTDPDLPEGWPLRVLAGLEALSRLPNGSLTVEPDHLILRGNSGSEDATSDLSRLLAQQLGDAASFEIDVTYMASLDPITGELTDQQCLDRVNTVLDRRKITFDPGSVEINEAAGEVLDDLAEILRDCSHVEMQIGGHTDTQGREELNLNISQARADAVLNGLLARRVLTSNLSAQGYGETRPVADNDTAEGREANRRIEFMLLTDVRERELREAAEERAAILANAPRPVMRPEGLAPDHEEEETE